MGAHPDGPTAQDVAMPFEEDVGEYEVSLPDPDHIFSDDRLSIRETFCVWKLGEVKLSELVTPEAAPDAKDELAKAKPRHTWDDCKARGNKKPHRHVQPADSAKGVLSINNAGPCKAAYDDSKYILASEFRLEDGAFLHFSSTESQVWSDVLRWNASPSE